MACCELEEIAVINNIWIVEVLDGETSDNVAVTSACVRCGAIPGSSGKLADSPLYMIRVRERIGRTGGWRDLGLPRFDRIGRTVGDPAIIWSTVKSRRFHDKFENMTDANLRGRIRTLMDLPANLWPDALISVHSQHPVILHHGLAVKFAVKRDRDHVFLCSYLRDSILYPTEVWVDIHNEKPHIRFLKKLSTASEQLTVLVSVDVDTSLVVTGYILNPVSYGMNRHGKLVFASWAAPT